jgi:hypothetical protein
MGGRAALQHAGLLGGGLYFQILSLVAVGAECIIVVINVMAILII